MVSKYTHEKLPNHAERVSQTKQILKHDLWFREQVAIALLQAKSSSATWIESETVRANMKKRAEIRKFNE